MSPTLIVFVIVYLSGLVIALTNGAHWAFYLYELVYFLNPENRWWSHSLPSLGYSMVTVVMLLLTYITAYKKYSTNKIMKLPYIKWWFLFLASFVVAYFFAINAPRHFDFSVDLLKTILIIGLAYKVLNTQQKLEWALLAYLVGAAYIGYEAFVVGRDGFGRVEGIGMVDSPGANSTAAAIAHAIPLLIFYFWRGGIKLKIAATVMGVFIINGLILINSRGAFLGAAASVLYFMFEMFRNRVNAKHQKLIALTFVFIGVIGVATLVDESFIDRMNTLIDVENESRSGSNRYRLWIIAVEMSKDYPFGAGVSGFNLLSPYYVPEHLFTGGQKYKAVHSIWMQALSEVGWIGFISFLMILFYCYRFLQKIKVKSRQENNTYNYYLAHALLSSFVGYFITASFINQFRVQMVYWMILFISCFYSLVIINDPESDQKNIQEVKTI